MNCRDFRDNVHEFVDEALDAPRQRAAREHLAGCADCQRQVEQLRALSEGLHAATAGISLSWTAQREILAAVREDAQPAVASGWRETWEWIIGHPMRLLAPAAVFAIVLWLNLQVRHHAASPTTTQSMRVARQTTIDVPLSSEVHVFQVRNGMVIDTVVTQIAESHATFSRQFRGE